MPCEQIIVKSFEAYQAKLKEFSGKRIFVLFFGSTDESGDSWCSDCRDCEPVLEKAMTSSPDNSYFIMVEVGDRATWKSADNVYRKDPNLKLESIPTLIEIGTDKRLTEECVDEEKVRNFFS